MMGEQGEFIATNQPSRKATAVKKVTKNHKKGKRRFYHGGTEGRGEELYEPVDSCAISMFAQRCLVEGRRRHISLQFTPAGQLYGNLDLRGIATTSLCFFLRASVVKDLFFSTEVAA
jgi:hypothetical protein